MLCATGDLQAAGYQASDLIQDQRARWHGHIRRLRAVRTEPNKRRGGAPKYGALICLFTLHLDAFQRGEV